MCFLILPMSNQCNWNWLSWECHVGENDQFKSKRQIGNIVMGLLQMKTHRVKIRSGPKSQHFTSGHLHGKKNYIPQNQSFNENVFIVAGVKYDHSLFWFYYSIYIFLKSICQLGKCSMDIFGNWNSFHVEDGQYRQKCYSLCPGRCFKKHQSLLVKGSGCLHQFHLEVWWHLVTISAVPEWAILLHWPWNLLYSMLQVQRSLSSLKQHSNRILYFGAGAYFPRSLWRGWVRDCLLRISWVSEVFWGFQCSWSWFPDVAKSQISRRMPGGKGQQHE